MFQGTFLFSCQFFPAIIGFCLFFRILYLLRLYLSFPVSSAVSRVFIQYFLFIASFTPAFTEDKKKRREISLYNCTCEHAGLRAHLRTNSCFVIDRRVPKTLVSVPSLIQVYSLFQSSDALIHRDFTDFR